MHRDAGLMVRVESRERVSSTEKHLLFEEGEKTKALLDQSIVQQAVRQADMGEGKLSLEGVAIKRGELQVVCDIQEVWGLSMK